jgi:hypothetical protein
LVEHDVGVNHEPVAILRVELGVLGVSPLRKDGAESGELGAVMAFGEPTGDIITHILLTED